MNFPDDESSLEADGLPLETEEDRAFQIERDAKENRDSALPPGEEVRVVSLTCVEVYTPSTVNNLIDGITKLGWKRKDAFSPSFTDLTDWVRSTRANPYGGAWRNLGRITDVQAPSPIGGGLQAVMPSGVAEIWAELHSVTPSITCLVLQFVVDEEASRGINLVFDETLATRTERVSFGWTYMGPAQQRTDLVLAERRRLRDSCHRWRVLFSPGPSRRSPAPSAS